MLKRRATAAFLLSGRSLSLISPLESALTDSPLVSPLECSVTETGGRGGPRKRRSSKIEAIAQDHFRNQVIRCLGESDSQPKIHFPLWRKIQIDHRENLMLLLADRHKIRGWSHGAVILNPA